MIYRGKKLGWCATSGTLCILWIASKLKGFFVLGSFSSYLILAYCTKDCHVCEELKNLPHKFEYADNIAKMISYVQLDERYYSFK